MTKKKKLEIRNSTAEFLVFINQAKEDGIEVRVQNENSVTEEFPITASDGKTYKTKHYNLDAIISVGYRVNTSRATAFYLSPILIKRSNVFEESKLNQS